MKRAFVTGTKVLLLATTMVSCLYIGYAVARQRAMEAAIRSLQDARQSLIDARANKGGHRARAIRLVEQAIRETRAGIRVAN